MPFNEKCPTSVAAGDVWPSVDLITHRARQRRAVPWPRRYDPSVAAISLAGVMLQTLTPPNGLPVQEHH